MDKHIDRIQIKSQWNRKLEDGFNLATGELDLFNDCVKTMPFF